MRWFYISHIISGGWEPVSQYIMIAHIYSVLFIGLGLYLFALGALSFRVSRRLNRIPKRPSFGPGVDKHIFLTGIEIEHGMVLNKENKLKPQSKFSKGLLESMMLK